MAQGVQILILLSLAAIAVLVTVSYRTKQDRELLTRRVVERGGQVVELKRLKKGHPFSDANRGWWAWRVRWRDGAGESSAWVLTTREGIKEWRD